MTFNSNVPALTGIQFLVDSQAKKTGVLIDLHEYQTLFIFIFYETDL